MMKIITQLLMICHWLQNIVCKINYLDKQFVKENAPENSGTRCLVDCPLVNECLYSAKRIYIDHPDRWSFYVWDALEHLENPTIDDKIELLKTSPYGVCAYKSDNNVVDHQTVSVMFENGATGTHNMVGGTSSGTRTIHITGTKGVIKGNASCICSWKSSSCFARLSANCSIYSLQDCSAKVPPYL